MPTKVTHIRKDLGPIFERAAGRRPTPGEMRALVAIQQLGGEDIDVAICSFLVEANRFNAKQIEDGLVRRHLAMMSRLNQQLTNNNFILARRAFGWIAAGIVVLAVYIFFCVWFLTKPEQTALDDCFDGRGKIETSRTGDRYCSPVDSSGKIIRWRLP